MSGALSRSQCSEIADAGADAVDVPGDDFHASSRCGSGRPALDQPDRVAGRVLEEGHPFGFAGRAELAGESTWTIAGGDIRCDADAGRRRRRRPEARGRRDRRWPAEAVGKEQPHPADDDEGDAGRVEARMQRQAEASRARTPGCGRGRGPPASATCRTPLGLPQPAMAQIEKLVPQPQEATAFGFLIWKDWPIRSSTKSMTEPPI